MAQNDSYLNSRYIDPLCDFGFKKLFGNDEVKDNLISFITSIYPQLEIVDLKYINSEVKGIIKSQRTAVYDIVCQLTTGQYPDKYIWKYSFKEEICNTPLTDKVNIAFIELPKFDKLLDEISDSAEIWIYLLKNLWQLTDIPEALQDDLFVKFFKMAEIHNLSPKELEKYQEDMFTRNDWQNCIKTAKRQGIEEGIRQTVINALRKDFDLQTIVDISGLSLEEVQSIQASLQ